MHLRHSRGSLCTSEAKSRSNTTPCAAVGRQNMAAVFASGGRRRLSVIGIGIVIYKMGKKCKIIRIIKSKAVVL